MISKKSYAKVNIFLKIVGTRGNYHTLLSRFVLVRNLYDIISFKKSDSFKITGDFGCELSHNTIYKAYLLLAKIKPQIHNLFKNIEIKVDKNIPYFAGLGGGSSNCATFLNMANEYFNLNLTKQELADIGIKVGADVPFFIYEYFSANVSGIGEVVKNFDEQEFDIAIFTPDIWCNTKEIFTQYRRCCLDTINYQSSLNLTKLNSKDIFNQLDIMSANDLYKPALMLNQNLNLDNIKQMFNISDEKLFFSGSGSSFFTIK